MRRSLKVRLALAAMTVGAVAVVALPANASTGILTGTGTGTISPGLSQAGGITQSFTFGISGSLVSTSGAIGDVTCSIQGDDTIGSWAQGAGGMSGSCDTLGPVSGNYTRSGALVTMAGTLNGASFSGRCGFVPINIDVTTELMNAFAISCILTLT